MKCNYVNVNLKEMMLSVGKLGKKVFIFNVAIDEIELKGMLKVFFLLNNLLFTKHKDTMVK